MSEKDEKEIIWEKLKEIGSTYEGDLAYFQKALYRGLGLPEAILTAEQKPKDEKEVMWEKLKHVQRPKFVHDMDLNSMYAHTINTVLTIDKVSGDAQNAKTFKVLKNR